MAYFAVTMVHGANWDPARGLREQAAWPAARRVAASPETANRRSVRALEKAGFTRARVIAGERDDRPELLCILDRQRIFGQGRLTG